MRLGRGTVVEEVPLAVPDLSSPHTVVVPSDELNSWAPYSVLSPVIELDHVKVIVDDPAVVTLPNQISSSVPSAPANCTPLVQVLTPPPLTELTVCPVASSSA